MTREEAIRILSSRDANGKLTGYTSGYTEALDMAIEALSVEPQECGKKILDISDGITKIFEPQEWISVKEAYTKGEWLFEPTQNINNPWKCSCCGHRAGRYKYKTYKFCPWCGAKMEGE